MACCGALLAMFITGVKFNIYSQVGLVTLIGLISKHGILIVEFANNLLKSGKDVSTAIIEASTIRLRPILMTSAAMIFGALPLVISQDYGFEARLQIGVVLIGGLLIGTIFTLTILPYVYVKAHRFRI